MAGLVLDSSVALAWLLPDERSAATLDRVISDRAIVPGLWPLEVGNALLVAQRRKRITSEQRFAALRVLSDLPISVDAETASRAWTDTVALADRHRLTLYDAAYLELAVRRSLPLATFDANLRRAAERESVGIAL